MTLYIIFCQMERKIVMKKLRRPKEEKKWMGVCAGLAHFLGIDVTFMRVIWVMVRIFPPVGSLTAILAYLALAFIIPEDKDYIDV